MEFSVRRPSPPNTYSYVQEENSGSTRKSVEIYLLFTCITNQILAIHMQSMNGVGLPGGTNRLPSPHWINFSVCASICL